MKAGLFYASTALAFFVCLWYSVELIGIYALALAACAVLLFSKNPIYALCPLLLVSMLTMTRRYDYSYYFYALPCAVAVVASAVYRLVKNSSRPKFSLQYVSSILVALSVSIGGIMVTDIESILHSAYFIIFLGIGMTAVTAYCFITLRSDTIEVDLSLCMTAVGLSCVGFLVMAYAKNIGGFSGDAKFLTDRFFWNNDLSTILLLTMPFSFYLASKAPHPSLYYLCGLLQGLALVLSLSRGGMLGAILTVPTAAVTIAFSKGKREQLAVTLLLFLLIAFVVWQGFLRDVMADVIRKFNLFDGNGRLELYRYAIKMFKENPVFGTGLGFVPDVGGKPKYGIFWYHSTVFQIAACLGVIGLLAYSSQLAVRIYLLIKGRSLFNLFVAFSWLGFCGYSMINVGTFVPFPFVALVTVMFVCVEKANGAKRDVRR